MIRVVLSPSKAMDFDTLPPTQLSSTPQLLEEADALVEVMQEKTASEIGTLMKLSEKLSTLNYDRFQEWNSPKTPSKQALFAFTGDTYKDIQLSDYTEQDFQDAQNKMRILSGLYGVLRPLDLISPYRLEMGTRLKNTRGKNLYEFWGTRPLDLLNEEFESAPASKRVLVNCASNEYFKVLSSNGDVNARVIEPVFKDKNKKGEFKVISFYAKRARGMMADFIVRHGVEDAAELKNFDFGGYYYDEESSTEDSPVFLRDS